LNQEKFGLQFSVSATSRAKRGQEIDGKDYYFISKEKFQEHIKNKDFLEWEEVYTNNFYGTLLSEVHRIWENGKVAIFDIDVVGGLRIKEKFPENTLAVFVQPPSIQVMETRLRNRNTDSEEKIKERLEKASKELEFSQKFDFVLVNDNLESAKKEAEKIVADFIKN
jgi:guanylate kinase